MDLCEAVYRLALPLEGHFRRLGEQLTEAAAAVPVAVGQAGEDVESCQAAGRALLTLETLLLLGTRLQALPEPKTAPLVARIDRLRGLLRSHTPGPVPSAPVKAPREMVVVESFVEDAEPPRKPAPRPAPPAPGPPERLLIDASNFLGRATGYALGDEGSKDRLLFRLQEYLRKHPAHKVTAFFDGQKTSSRTVGGVEERITSGLHTADDVIVDFVRGLPSAERRRCTLVSDDRGLASRVRNEGVRVESVAWLSARLVAPVSATPHPNAGMSQDELSEWEEFFRKPPQRPGR